jgi:hypothetical protein
MIKKSVFEEELVAGMHRELVKNATSQDPEGVEKAVDYLNSAIDIFEDAGMTTQADQVLRILAKIAMTRPQEYPSIQALMQHGVKLSDLKDLGRDAFAKARVNMALRKMHYSDKEIAGFLGHKNLMSEKDAAELLSPERAFTKMLDWMENPKTVSPSSDLKKGDEFNISSVANDENEARKKPKDPRKISDRHTRGLTPEKMVANLKNHGHPLNLADDNNISETRTVKQPESFEREYQDWLWKKEHPKRKITVEDIDPDLVGLVDPEMYNKADDNDLIELDNADADDLLNLDISDNALEVSEKDLKPETENFEDERD